MIVTLLIPFRPSPFLFLYMCIYIYIYIFCSLLLFGYDNVPSFFVLKKKGKVRDRVDLQQFNSIQFNSIQFNSIQFNSIQFNLLVNDSITNDLMIGPIILLTLLTAILTYCIHNVNIDAILLLETPFCNRNIFRVFAFPSLMLRMNPYNYKVFHVLTY
jgi:hypothetical protein